MSKIQSHSPFAVTCFLVVPAVILASVTSGFTQAFTNLNFESANIPAGTQVAGFIPATSGLPGWTTYATSPGSGSNSISQIFYDLVSTGGAGISVNDSNAPFSSSYGPISGKYSAYLFSENDGNALYGVGISQRGLVPFGTESLQVQVGFASSPFVITLGGQTIDMVPEHAFSNYTLYGGDISAFAGKIETLTFAETIPSDGAFSPGILSLDNIVFSTSPTPEPGTCGLFLGGMVLLGARKALGARHGATKKANCQSCLHVTASPPLRVDCGARDCYSSN
jgi:hypothetical protein